MLEMASLLQKMLKRLQVAMLLRITLNIQLCMWATLLQRQVLLTFTALLIAFQDYSKVVFWRLKAIFSSLHKLSLNSVIKLLKNIPLNVRDTESSPFPRLDLNLSNLTVILHSFLIFPSLVIAR